MRLYSLSVAEKRWWSDRSGTRARIGIDAQCHSEQQCAPPEYPDQAANVIDNKGRDTPAEVRAGTGPQQSIPDELNLWVMLPVQCELVRRAPKSGHINQAWRGRLRVTSRVPDARRPEGCAQLPPSDAPILMPSNEMYCRAFCC
jgi:hypothetical protein